MTEAPLLLSTVTPVYRGRDYLRELVMALAAVREKMSAENWPICLVEAVFVDDGSSDGSAELLEELGKEHAWAKPIFLSRNFGQHPATVAGILHSCGDWIATLDEDMQHPPDYIFMMITEAVKNHSDVVYANPTAPVHGSFLRDGASKLFKLALSQLSGNEIVRRFNSFRLLRGNVARAAAAVSSFDTYFDVALGWFTSRVSDLKFQLVDRRYQSEGKSGYTWRQLLRHARRMLVTSQVKLLRLGTMTGFLALILSGMLALFLALSKVLHRDAVTVQGWTTTIIGVLFFGGLSCFLIGICLEYMTVLVYNAQGRPAFLTVDRSSDKRILDWLSRR